MIRFLPFILIIGSVLGGLGYWRFVASKPSLITPRTAQSEVPIEVPKTLPQASTEERVKELEDVVTKLVTQVNGLKSQTVQTQSSSSSDSQISNVEGTVTELKARVSALEKATPAPQSTLTQSTVYIPLGSSGGSGDKNWISISRYGATIDPAEYPGYTSMQLEVNFRMVQKSGTAYARLYNVTDSSYKEQVSTTSDDFSWQTSYNFTLPSGKKTYTLQIKSTEGVDVQLQSARIKVNF